VNCDRARHTCHNLLESEFDFPKKQNIFAKKSNFFSQVTSIRVPIQQPPLEGGGNGIKAVSAAYNFGHLKTTLVLRYKFDKHWSV
jgi:hypothetical protein